MAKQEAAAKATATARDPRLTKARRLRKNAPKVRIKFNGTTRHVGRVVDVRASVARGLIKHGAAEEVDANTPIEMNPED